MRASINYYSITAPTTILETNPEHLLCVSESIVSNYTWQTGLTCLKQDTDAARDVSFSK